MLLTVGETAKLFGVTARALRYYGELGLLEPAETSEAGYRYYGDAELRRLQEIVFFRELEIPLSEIGEILGRGDYDAGDTLKKHRALLVSRRERLDGLIRLVDETLKGDIKMKDYTPADVEAEKSRYAAEAKEKWGATSEYAESARRESARGGDERAVIAEEADEIFRAFAAAADLDPAGETARALVRRWQAHISAHYYECTDAVLASLGEMYVLDERFREHLDRFGDGTARFMSEAIAALCA